MTQPAYIIPANYYENAAVDDVQDILDDLDTLLAANGWTVDAPGGPYTTPADTWGRWFKLTFVRATAARLKCTLTDDQGRSSTQREMDITGTQTVRYYYGTRYLLMENINQTDYLHATLLSLSPDTETAHNKYCLLAGAREAVGGSINAAECGAYDQVNNLGVYAGQGSLRLRINGAGFGSTVSELGFRHVSGARKWHSCWNVGTDDGTNFLFRGKIYNALLGYSGLMSFGQEFTVPIDQATTATFKAVRIPAASAPFFRIAMRKS